jgi:hypothetical protein
MRLLKAFGKAIGVITLMILGTVLMALIFGLIAQAPAWVAVALFFLALVVAFTGFFYAED